MRRFRFRLERLLALKRYREREWETKLARATGACMLTQRSIDRSKRAWARSFLSLGGDGLDLERILSAEAYRKRMEATVEQLEAQLERQTAELEEVRTGYLSASRERKVLAKLKERKESEYMRDQRQEEFKSMDEIASVSHGRHADGGR